MDLDVKLFRDALSDNDAAARAIYEQGGNSQSFAIVTLATGLSMDLASGMELVGVGVNGGKARGIIQGSALTGDTTLQIQYATYDLQEMFQNCRVGGLPAVGEERSGGCFAATGALSSPSMDGLAYSYMVLTDNQNGHTIQSLSTEAQALYTESLTPNPFADYAKFVDYYGAFDYANQIVTASFRLTPTEFDNGKVDFTDTSAQFRKDIAAGTVVMMSIFMKVIGDMEHAIDDCVLDTNMAAAPWDSAVAFYSGSLEGTDGSGSGLLLYALADFRCINFSTCFSGTSGISNVNRQVIDLFRLGQSDSINDACDNARLRKERIVQLMLVPLIQQRLHRAFLLDEQGLGESSPNGQAMVAAASILPYVHACNSEDAALLYASMSQPIPSFAEVKEVLERNYEYMGVRCVDIGGLYSSPDEDYFSGAEPCVDLGETTGSPTAVTSEPSPAPTLNPAAAPTSMLSVSVSPSKVTIAPTGAPPPTSGSISPFSVFLIASIVLSSAVSVCFTLF